MSKENSETPRERARRMGVPYYEPRRIQPYQGPNPIVGVCGGCGRDVHRVEGYSCPKDNCPIQPKSGTFSADILNGTGFTAFDGKGFKKGELVMIGGTGAPNSAIQGFAVDMVKDHPKGDNDWEML